MFYNCALTSRHWEDDQIRKRACKKGENRGKTQITKRSWSNIFKIPLETALTVIEFLRYTFVVMQDSCLGNISDIFHYNNENN